MRLTSRALVGAGGLSTDDGQALQAVSDSLRVKEAGTQPAGRTAPGLAWIALAAACATLAIRYALVAASSYTFNEATYVELAAHPWRSSFYPDTVFLRHPPLGLALLAVWRLAFGDAEWVMRVPALVLSAGGVALGWDAARRATRGAGPAAGVAALALGLNFLVNGYALEATMYPLAFLLAAAAVWGRLAQVPRVESWALVALALTHLFGFLFLAAALVEKRMQWRSWLRSTWLAWAWLLAATLIAVAVNTQGDIMRWGPLGQLLRSSGTASDALAVRPLAHLASGALAVLCLGPFLLGGLWRERRGWPAWTIAVAVLVLYLFLGAPYPRYALVPLPFVVAGGAVALAQPGVVPKAARTRVRGVALTLLVVAATMPIGFAYMEHGPDPRARGDVAGLQAWDDAVAGLAPAGKVVATAGPTATAYYLLDQGWSVADSTQAPYRIQLEPRTGTGGAGDAGNGTTLLRLDAPSDLSAAADAWIVPDHWAGRETLVAQGAAACGHVQGLGLWALDCAATWPA